MAENEIRLTHYRIEGAITDAIHALENAIENDEYNITKGPYRGTGHGERVAADVKAGYEAVAALHGALLSYQLARP